MEKLSRGISYLSNILNDAGVRIGEIRDCIEDTDSELRDCGKPEPSKRSLFMRECVSKDESLQLLVEVCSVPCWSFWLPVSLELWADP